MTVTHIVWEQEKEGEEAFLYFNKLYDLFLGESDKELTDYLASPLLNNNKRLIYLFERIQLATKNNYDSIKGSFILNKWNKGRKQELSINYLCACVEKLGDAIIDIVVLREMQPEKTHRWRLLQAILRNQTLPNELAEAIQQLRTLNAEAPQGIQQLSDDFELAYQHYHAQSTDREQIGMALLNEMEGKLDTLYQTYKSKFALERINLEKTARKDEKKIPPTPPASTVNLMELYHRSYLMSKYDQEDFPKYYEDFLTLFEVEQEKLDPIERYSLCKYTLNALSRALKNGHLDLWPTILLWNKRRLAWSPETVIEEGINDYLNVVITGCICGEDEFVENYINTYSSKLTGGSNDLTVNYARAELFFLRKQFSESLTILHNTWEEGKDYHLLYVLRYRKLMITSAVELVYLDNFDLSLEEIIEKTLTAGVDTFRKYLERGDGKISSDLVEQHLSFLSLVRRLINLIYRRFTEDITLATKELLFEIEATPKLVGRKWLLDVAQRLLLSS